MNVDLEEFKQLLTLKCKSHLKYLYPRATEKTANQINESFTSIISIIKNSNNIQELNPQVVPNYLFNIENKKIHEKVLATYNEIYYTIYNQYVGKTEGMLEVERL